MELVFVTGGALRRIFIKDRAITMISPEMGFTPITIELDKLAESATQEKMQRLKLTDDDKFTIKSLAELGSEEDIAKDIIKDFKKTGWRCIKQRK